MALEEQMEMNFGTRGVDPVSGNDVPVGSLPEEVRDDIPAQLSEGEYVVPADVVRYYGVKFFEDLRIQAKMGFDEMAANGRIGGDPIDEEDIDIEFSMDDLEVVEMDEGGDVKKEPKFKNRYEKIMYYLSQLMKEKEEEEEKRKGKSIAEQINFGGKYDEGGDVFAQKGGFDMTEAGKDTTGIGSSSTFEARTYMNDAGHKIIIMFINGEPVTPIPEGYYPVGDTIIPTTEAQPTPSGGGGGGGGSSAPAPTPINYKELSLQELQDMVNNQKSLGAKAIGATVLGKIAMWDQTRRTKEEIERRIADPATTEVDKMRLNNLLEIANKEEPGLIKTLLDKVTGKEFERIVSQIEPPVKPDVDFMDPTMAGGQPYVVGGGEPYTPEVTQSDAGLDPAEIIQESIKDAADRQLQEEAKKISAQAAKNSFKVSTPQPTPVNEMSPRVKKARQNTQKVLKDMRDRGASREDRTASMAAGARTEQVLRDLDRGVVRGFEEGGSVDKPKVKEVVKGLEKASKSHAKQAAKLKTALGSKKKKSK